MFSEVPSRIPQGAGIQPVPWIPFVCVAVLLSGCATRQACITPLDSPVAATTKAASATRDVLPTSQPSTESLPTGSRPPVFPVSPRPPSESQKTSLAAEFLRKDFEVSLLGSSSLRVSPKNRTARRLPALFEESILLGKIRAVLQSANPPSRRTASSASFQGGIATISFDRDIAPKTAAAAVSRMISLDGVNEVRANFPND
jgi:hypothetical protein